ncbi:MAG TPA: heme-binding domain-containing protein [Hanamia sp.]|nr:heme-binding domain-containing protein [Hanamia sp.]
MKKILKVIIVILVIALITIQFIRPAKNQGEEMAANQITAVQQVPEDIQQILKVSCYDCHSNTTRYPWYENIQPVAWFLNDHIVEGKKEVNFSIFVTYPVYRRYKKFKEIQKQIKDNEMPLFSYTILHRDAILNPDQKSNLITWAANAQKEMEAKYPADSLVKPK